MRYNCSAKMYFTKFNFFVITFFITYKLYTVLKGYFLNLQFTNLQCTKTKHILLGYANRAALLTSLHM